jgi:membrane-associated protein
MFDPVATIQWLGPFLLIGLFVIMFAECGLLIGVVLPGDPTLFTAGLLVATGAVGADLWMVCVAVTAGAILGNLFGYWLGAKVGPPLFERPSSWTLKNGQVAKTRRFFDRHGPRAIVLARFIPLARTLITLVAGIARMNPRTYLIYSTVGGVLWATGMTLVGALLGQIPWVQANVKTILLIMLFFIATVSIVPIVTEYLRRRRESPAGPAGRSGQESG